MYGLEGLEGARTVMKARTSPHIVLERKKQGPSVRALT